MFSYDGDPCEGEGGHNITVAESPLEAWKVRDHLRISMSYFVMMVELVNPCARSVKIAMAFTSEGMFRLLPPLSVHTNGIHMVKVQFCACYGERSQPKFQLLRCSWLPASTEDLHTAFTFQDRYTEFLRAIRIWEHLKLLKRGGRGHKPEGVGGTEPSQCAVECPACPHPERNMPQSGKGHPKMIGIDNKDRDANDMPALGDGWAHFILEAPNMEHLWKWGQEEHRNLCDSNLRAVDLANSKYSKGYKATGVGGVFYARHGLVRKNGLGNLQKGERYAIMDFIAFYTLMGAIFTSIVFSYEILHIYGHGEKCQYKYSFNYQKWLAHTDGEDLNASLSTGEMTPGAQFNALDSHAAHWNWHKIVRFDSSLSSQLVEALKESALHRAFFLKLLSSIDSMTLEKWEADVTAWRMISRSLIRLQKLKIQLIEEEEAAARLGEVAAHDVSPSVLIHTGMELEEYQRNLVVEARIIKEATSTDHKMRELMMKRNVLRHRIDKWREIQDVYMPSITKHLAHSVSPNDKDQFFESPETIPLYLPSTLPLISFRPFHPSLWDYKCTQIGSSQRNGTRMYASIGTYREKPQGAESGGDDVENGQSINEGFRVEWAKSRARMYRWEEEGMLMVEEMCRVICYMNWRSHHW
ncbi:hypothetical protein BGY98DRAFT_936390 [Russula aff. rugulosa BPL654]|nr:hypothetical protein BGY98DRAFT_936390 [Russula aff. rugulosa BPL654]